ncbi:hypothetical protein Q8F55_002469 [Vanrija albida]|uniref:Uncharacterized protein n=1 Tax=Vanrija albida TaxID=181172 RepID=A0ABR3QA00_9TREE
MAPAHGTESEAKPKVKDDTAAFPNEGEDVVFLGYTAPPDWPPPVTDEVRGEMKMLLAEAIATCLQQNPRLATWLQQNTRTRARKANGKTKAKAKTKAKDGHTKR